MKARAHGDFSENAEFKYAKERQGYVSARLGQLKKRLGDIGMLNLTNIPADRAGYGSRVWVLDIKKFGRSGVQAGDYRGSGCSAGIDLHDFAHRQGAARTARSAMKCGYRRLRESREFEVVRLKTIHEDV